MFSVIRNESSFGPYSLDALKKYVEDGQILLVDQVLDHSTNINCSTREIFRKYNIKVEVKHNGSISNQIKTFDKGLLIPSMDILKKYLMNDKSFLALAFMGLAPAFLIKFTFASYLTFYMLALYFSVIWAFFFYHIFSTKQVNVISTVSIFFLSQVSALILVNLQNIPPFNILYAMTKANNIIGQLLGFILGVGVLEECIKGLPLVYLIYKSKEPLIPRTLVYYGLISGIGFGVLEGVQYQTTINKELDYGVAFFMNVARLTSLPFLHAVWSGIFGYFLSFAYLYPLNRRGLFIMAIAIPSLLHGCYDVFGWSLLGLSITIFSVILLVFYLNKAKDYQSNLR